MEDHPLHSFYRDIMRGVVVLFFTLLVVLSSIECLKAAPVSHNLVRSTGGSTGTAWVSTTYRLRGTLAQSAVASGISSNGTVRLTSGYWAVIPPTGTTPPSHHIYGHGTPPTATSTVTGTPPPTTPTVTGTPPTLTPTVAPRDQLPPILNSASGGWQAPD